ncbi:ctlh domain containing protein [Niveomyces insectorum RCEF 264]|uniref:Ctlh domain containing protein n=1 Tax=Niveomyces insectorum RCEF 264 TaxID=1081102 RepID=A0A168A6X5_9HYPO|nr:ctlh domain containing protein [Niveomyces insectorum RCEF 264]
MTSSSSTATPAKLSWESRVNQVKAPKSDINALILDYLTMEGYPKAAANFSKEANLRPQQDDSFIQTRQAIQSSIHRGDIEGAITDIISFDHQILDQDPQLHFALLRLQLVEIIRSSNGGDIQAALAFATDQLGPRASMWKEFLPDLEQTMSMLFFSTDKLPDELKKLLSPDLRREVADKVNKAILYQHGKRREAAIRNLVKMRAWAENMARDKDSIKDLPDSIDLGLQGTNAEGTDSRLHENGHEPMITT